MRKEKIRIAALVMALVVFCGFFVFRLTDYQIVNGDEYKAQATQGYTRTVTLKAPRGEIVDRNGEPLVSNRVGFNIQLDRVYPVSYTHLYGVKGKIALFLFCFMIDKRSF